MIAKLISQSFILNSVSQLHTKTHDSLVLNLLFQITSRSLRYVTQLKIVVNSQTLLQIANLPWKSIMIFFFVVALVLVPGYDTITVFSTRSLGENAINTRMRVFSFSLYLLLFSCLILMLVLQHKRKLLRITFPRTEILLLIVLIIAEITAITSFNSQTSLAWLIKLLRGFIVYFIFSRLFLRKKHYLYIIYAFMLALFMEGFLALIQYLHGGLIAIPFESISNTADIRTAVLYLDTAYYFRVVGTFMHPNVLSSYAGILLPVAFVFLFSKDYKMRLASFILSILGVTVVFVTLSRWGLITLVFSLILVFIFLRREIMSSRNMMNSIKYFFLISSILLIIVFANSTISGRFLEFSLEDKSLQVRLDLINESLYIISVQPWLGIGGGNFPNFFVNYDITEKTTSKIFPQQVHNIYLLLATEIGILGSFVFWLSCILLIRKFILLQRSLILENRLIVVGFLVSVLTFLFNGLWETRSITTHTAMFFWMEMGLLVNLSGFTISKRQPIKNAISKTI